MNDSPTGAIILAAGASTRMGEPKQLLTFEGESLLRRATNAALAAGCPVVVALGANAERVAREVESLPVRLCFNEEWSQGLSSSVRAGLRTFETDETTRVSAAVLLPCDQPLLTSEVLKRLISARHASGKPIVVSGYDGIWGTPMLFARELWPELRELSGSRGAQSVARRHAEDVECVPFPGGAFDLDTREDYARLLTESTALNS